MTLSFFFFQAEDGIRDLVRSRGLGDVYKRQIISDGRILLAGSVGKKTFPPKGGIFNTGGIRTQGCLLYTSDAADERSSVDLGGRRIIKKKSNRPNGLRQILQEKNIIEMNYTTAA
mgnify:CR=1 FL=1